jgi:hypothetical protein
LLCSCPVVAVAFIFAFTFIHVGFGFGTAKPRSSSCTCLALPRRFPAAGANCRFPRPEEFLKAHGSGMLIKVRGVCPRAGVWRWKKKKSAGFGARVVMWVL